MENKCIQACVEYINAFTQTEVADFDSLHSVSIFEQYHQLSNMYPNDLSLIFLNAFSIRFELRLYSFTDDPKQLISSITLVIGGPIYSVDVRFCSDFIEQEKQEIYTIIQASKSQNLLETIILLETKLTEFDKEFKKRREQSLLVQSSQNIDVELILTKAISKSYADFTEENYSEMKHSIYGIDQIREQLAEKYDQSEPKLITSTLPSPLEQILQLQTCSISRFKSDFDEIELIGSGGFGKVFKSRNKFDGNYYALKRIALDYSNKKLTEKTKNEAVLLSRIQHPNIVRYFQAWVEEYIKDEYENMDDDDEYEDDVDESESEQEIFQRRSSEEEDQDFEYECGEEDVQIDWMNDGGHEIEIAPEESIQTPVVAKQIQKENKQLLYIQMEYCTGDTLKKKIDEKELKSDQKKKIIRQILDALYYLHKNNIIHRDLKPQNIFLDGDLNVKLGDFGLATEMKQEIKFLDNKLTRNSVGAEDSLLTQGVGTFLYLAPEQEDSHYDAKADIYSLGIILFEMYYPFKTEMERINYIKQLRDKGLFPSDFESKVEIQDLEIRDKIAQLVNKNPLKRPSTQELLNKYKDQRLQQVIRSIANPNCPDFYELVQTLFDCKQLKQQNNFFSSCLEEALGKSRDLYGFQLNLVELYSRVDKIFKMHGGLQLNLSPLLPSQNTVKYLNIDDKIIEYEYQDQSFRFITQQGELVQYCSNLLQSTIYWLKMLPLNNFRRYTLGEVQHINQQTLAKQYCASYDIISETQNYSLRELLCISRDIINQFSNKNNFELQITHTQLFELILLELGFNQQMMIRMLRDQQFLYKLTKYQQNPTEKSKVHLVKILKQEFNFSDDKADKFLKFISFKTECIHLHEKVQNQLNDSGKKIDKNELGQKLESTFTKYKDQILKIISQFKILEEQLQQTKLKQNFKVTYETFQINELTCYYSGFTFEFVEISKNETVYKNEIQLSRSEPVHKDSKLLKRHLRSNSTTFIIGGDYSHQIYNKEQEHHKYATGIHVYLDQLYYSKFVKFLSNHSFSKEVKQFEPLAKEEGNKSYGAVIITENLTESQPYQIAELFWNHKISAIIVDPKHSKIPYFNKQIEIRLYKKQEQWKALMRRSTDKKDEDVSFQEIYDKYQAMITLQIEQHKYIKRAQSKTKQ